MTNFDDLTNRRFNKLVVIERCEDYVSPKGKKLTQWLCRCDCGNVVKKTSSNLKRKSTYGCNECSTKLKHDLFSVENEFKIDGDITYLYTRKGVQIIIDTDDYEKVKPYCWWINNTGYAEATLHYSTKHIQLHRLIMNILDNVNIIIDHKNGNPLDNRKCNLRLCTRAENSYNKKMQPYNTSGVTGVYWNTEKRKWSAQICYKNKNINLGYYENKEDAIKARKQGEDEYFGEFSFSNSRGIK